MRAMHLLLALALLLTALSSLTAAEWAKVLIHTHPDSPDTLKMPPEKLMQAAAEFGFDAVIMTDHYAQLRAKETYDEYQAKMVNPPQTKKGRPLVVILGAEISTKESSHILALNLSSWPADIVNIPQQQLLNRLAKMKATTVGAHPFNSNYKLNYDALDGLNGLELFNDAKIQPGGRYKDTLDFALAKMREGRNFYFTSGSDLHGYPEVGDERMTRATYVRVKDFTAKDILAGLVSGQCYASQHTVRIANPELTLTDVQNNPPYFHLELQIDYPAHNDKKIQIYRDGNLLANSTVILKKGETQYQYEWLDENASPGRHSYIIEVVGCLVTSPIWLTVPASKTQLLPKPKPAENLVRKFYQYTLVQQADQPCNEYGYFGQGFMLHNYNPAPRARTDFPINSCVEIYFIFKNNADLSLRQSKETLFGFGYQLISPTGEILDQAAGDLKIDWRWQIGWYVFGRPIRERGNYTIKLLSHDGALIDSTRISCW